MPRRKIRVAIADGVMPKKNSRSFRRKRKGLKPLIFLTLKYEHLIICVIAAATVALAVWLHVSRATLFSISLQALAGRTIAIDAGHGGYDPGAVGYTGVLEKDVVLEIALRLRDYLVESGANVVMTRDKDMDFLDVSHEGTTKKARDLNARIKIINSSDAEVLISIHANDFPSARWHGAQTFYYSRGNPLSARLAKAVQAELIRLTGNTQRMASSRIDQYILKQVAIPAVTVEVGFLSNPNEEKLLSDAGYRATVAWSIYVGLARYFSEIALTK